MWTSLVNFNLNNDWQLSDKITVNTFRLKHTWVNPYRYSAIVIVALARVGDEGIEIYSPQKIYPKSELEIIQFPLIPLGWQYSFAVKQLIFNSNLIQWSLSIDMPLYPISSNDPNPIASTAFSTTNYAVTATAALKIASANPARKEMTIYNTDTKNTLCIDLVNTVSATNAAFIVPPGQVYISDIEWLGDVYAIAKAGTINIIVREFV